MLFLFFTTVNTFWGLCTNPPSSGLRFVFLRCIHIPSPVLFNFFILCLLSLHKHPYIHYLSICRYMCMHIMLLQKVSLYLSTDTHSSSISHLCLQELKYSSIHHSPNCSKKWNTSFLLHIHFYYYYLLKFYKIIIDVFSLSKDT